MQTTIRDSLKQHMTFSFEVFPPKVDQPIEPLLDTLEHLYPYRPDYISCTYGAGGTNKGRNFEIVDEIIKHDSCNALMHFTCIGNTREDIKSILQEYVNAGLMNVLALRGDLPANWEGTRGDFSHADELISYIKELYPQMCIGAACYPEMYYKAPSYEYDIAFLRVKQDNGADFLMTQLCHDVETYERFRDQARKAGVHIPIIVGLMPVLNKDAIIRMTLSNGSSIPRELAAIIGKYGDDPESFKKAGKEYTAESVHRFMNAGIDGIHFYSLNRYKDLADIIELSGIRPVR